MREIRRGLLRGCEENRMANLTIIILTKNEEQDLEKCIASFKGVAKRMVIFNLYSTDKTMELAVAV